MTRFAAISATQLSLLICMSAGASAQNARESYASLRWSDSSGSSGGQENYSLFDVGGRLAFNSAFAGGLNLVGAHSVMMFPKSGGSRCINKRVVGKPVRVEGYQKLCVTIRAQGSGSYRVSINSQDKTGLTNWSPIHRVSQSVMTIGSGGCQVQLVAASRSYFNQPGVEYPMSSVTGQSCDSR